MTQFRKSLIILAAFTAGMVGAVATLRARAQVPAQVPKQSQSAQKPAAAAVEASAVKATAKAAVLADATKKPLYGPHDWNQWGGSSLRNNTPEATNIPEEWDPGDFDRKTGDWVKGSGKNIKWVARLGSQTYGNPVVANGQVVIGTNNGAGRLKRYPATQDVSCLVAFNEKDGAFQWQHSSEKLPTGRVHDWALLGICSAALVEGDRLWFVTSRGEVRCLDTQGFLDNENDGPFTTEQYTDKDEADVVWVLDMMTQLGISQHNMCNCSVTTAGDLLFVCTSNGVDESHINIPNTAAPSFLCLDKHTGKIHWSDASPGVNILHGQWSSPCVATIGGVPQVMFAGGDGYLYSFKAEATPKPELLWKFDCNPKESKYIVGGRGTRNEMIGTPVVYQDKVYVAVGQDPEHGEGVGHLWCIDPSKRGDISPELAFNVKDLTKPIAHKRLQAVVKEDGDVARSNPNTGVVWHYSEHDQNANGKFEFEETMHRTIGTVVIKDDLLYLSDFSGLFHCVDALTGKPYWTHDMLAAAWGSALIADGKVYMGDEDGDVTVFKHGKEKKILSEVNMVNSVYSTPIVANGVLYISNKTHLFAIAAEK